MGVLVQTNYGGVLTVDGQRVGERLGRHVYREILQEVLQPKQEPVLPPRNEEGSVMIVVATDAPLGARNLERLARRAVLGLARTGSFMSNGSGDFVIAFSTGGRLAARPPTATRKIERLENARTSPLFLAVVERVEEAVYNSLTRATTVRGLQGHTVAAISIEKLRAIVTPQR